MPIDPEFLRETARGSVTSPTHVAFGDESAYQERVRSLALVTCPIGQETRIREQIALHLSNAGVSELKWKDVRSWKRRIAAEAVFNLVLREALEGNLRIDTLVWDAHAPYHQSKQREPIESLEVKYYQAFKFVFGNQWPHGATWLVRVDEHSGINWSRLLELANLEGFEVEFIQNGKQILRVRDDRYRLQELVQAQSEEEPFVQVADLFAGLGVFSRNHFSQFRAWQKAGKSRVLDEDAFSSSQKVRFQLLKALLEEIHGKGLPLWLSSQGLRSAPKCPINFWQYAEPIHRSKQEQLFKFP